MEQKKKHTQLAGGFFPVKNPHVFKVAFVLEAETLKFLDSTTIFEGLTKKQKVSLAEAGEKHRRFRRCFLGGQKLGVDIGVPQVAGSFLHLFTDAHSTTLCQFDL